MPTMKVARISRDASEALYEALKAMEADYCKLWYAHVGRLPLCHPDDEPPVRQARAALHLADGARDSEGKALLRSLAEL